MIKYILFIDSGDLLAFRDQAKEKGYTIEVACTGLYSHRLKVDLDNKVVTMTDQEEGIEYLRVVDFEL